MILCATTRLAQTLRSQLPPEQSVWLTRSALTVAQWLAHLAEDALLAGLADLPQALDPFAEKLLWEQVIGESLDENAAPLFDLPGMAAAAAEAQALVRVWQLHPEKSPDLAEEAHLFIGWQAAFKQRCQAAGWIDLAGQQLLLLDLLEAGHLTLPKQVDFAGFDRYTPLENRLMAVLEGRHVRVEKWPAGDVDRSDSHVLPCADVDAECAALVAWVQAQLQANPQVRLGIVAPDLQSVRDRLEFLLDDVLHPALLRPDAAEMVRCYNFSLGRRLADLPLVRTALEVLALGMARGKVEQARLSALLLGTGYALGGSETDERARLDVAMRRDLGYFTTLPALIRLGQRLAVAEPDFCQQTMAHLESFVAGLSTLSARRQLPGQWTAVFVDLLQRIGWPGERSLSSHEFQARRAFLAELAGFGRLDSLLGPIGFSEAVRRLGQLCRVRIFQPETRGQPSIQILGVLESAGLSFDALWVMGMNDDVWPPAPRPNPLLPAEMLRAAGAPHASAEIEVDFASRVHARLLRSAPLLTFSYSAVAGNRLLRPSPLLGAMPVLAAAPPAVVATLAAHLAHQAAHAGEAISDALAPPVAEGEKLSGGSWLLRAQAICPAWGFYQYRLGAEAMETPVEGLDPAARGTLVHAALEAFWSTLHDSAALAALGELTLAEAIEQAISRALLNFETTKHLTLPTRFRQLEGRRLARLLAEWLAVEAKREQPFTVIACEQPAEIEIEQIRVKMVVDRIDQLADGRRLIIDYKTGAAIDIHNWAEARLSEPQLPIYAALVAVDAVAAVVFAKVLLDKPGFAGVAEEKDLLPGVLGIGDEKQKIFAPEQFPDWPAVIAHWQRCLRNIALEVKAGVAGVSFSDAAALKYCEVKPLLRLAERARQLEKSRAEAVFQTAAEEPL